MKKFLPVLAIAAVLLPACCVFANVKHPDPKLNAAERDERATVALVRWVGKDKDGDPTEVPEGTEGAKLGTGCAGVWIDRNTFVTAEHCIDNFGKPAETKVLEELHKQLPPELAGLLPVTPRWDPTGHTGEYSAFGDVYDTETGTHVRNVHPCKVLATDWVHDLALVRATTDAMNPKVPDHAVAPLATDTRVGDEVDIVGHPVGMWWSYTHGWVAQIRPNMRNVDNRPTNLLQISAPVWFGNSGGGAFNSSGQLVGIASFIRAVPNMAFFVRYDVIKTLIDHNITKT